MVKTSELTGSALDWAVAKCGEWDGNTDADLLGYVRGADGWAYNPSIDWSQGGAIIEWEKITLRFSENNWVAEWWADNSGMAKNPAQRFCPNRFEVGPTPLVAAMRCFVASRLGAEVDVTSELLGV